jgi:hypothetical protein
MFDDISVRDEAHRRYMRKASTKLVRCIERARAGKATMSPSNLVWQSVPVRNQRGWDSDDIDRLRAMRDDGYKVREMAEVLNRSQESIKHGISVYLRLQEPAE